MPTYYVEDHEEVTGLKPDGSPVTTGAVKTKVVTAPEAPEVVAKVVTPPVKAEPKKTAARTKTPKVAPAPVAETA